MRKLIAGFGCVVLCVVAEVISAHFTVSNYHHHRGIVSLDLAGMALIPVLCVLLYRSER